MNIDKNKGEYFFLNKRNIGNILNSIIQNNNLNLSNGSKQELLEMIINEMKITNGRIDRNKLGSKSPVELNAINDQLNKMIINSITPKLNSIGSNQNNIIMSQRPMNTNTNNRQNNNRDNYFAPVPVRNNYNSYDPRDMSMNSRNNNFQNNDDEEEDDDGDKFDKKYKNFMAERQMFLPDRNAEKPPTPDFSLDGSGKKKKKQQNQNQNNDYQNNDYQNNNYQNNNYQNNNYQNNNYQNNNGQGMNGQGMNGNYDINGNRTNYDNYNSGILNNFSSNNPIDMMAVNSGNEYASNINSFDTGIDPRIIEQFKEKDIDKALAEMAHIRDMNISIPNRGDPTNGQNKGQNQNRNNNSPNNNLALPDANGNVNLRSNPINTINTQPMMQQPMMQQPIMQQPMMQQPIMQQPMMQQPMIQQLQIQQQLQEYQSQMANELRFLKEQLNNKNNIGNNQEYINQINALNAEISQYKNINVALNTQLEEIKQKISGSDINKLQMLDAKKKEILFELEKLQEEHKVIEELVEKNNGLEEKINNKRHSIMELIQKYDYKIYGNEHSFDINYSDLIKINNEKPIYRYKLPYKISNVNQISLIDHNFNGNLFNITPYNNKLMIGEIGDYNINIDKLEDISYKYYKTNSKNYLDITLEPGKYDLELLVVRLNTILNNYGLEIGYDPTKFIVQLRSKDELQFKLIKSEYDIYGMLGFDITDEKSNKFKGKRSADLKNQKVMECYVMNINKEKPFAKVNMSNDKVLSSLLVIKPYIDEMEYLDFYFVGENKRPYWQEYNDFNFIIELKGIIKEDNKEEYINRITVEPNIEDDNNNENNNDSNDLLKTINGMLELKN